MSKGFSKIRILFCMNHIIMGGLEKVLCQYLLPLKAMRNIEVSVVSKEKVTEPYFIDFFRTNKIELIDDFVTIKRKKIGFIKLGGSKRKVLNNIINALKWKKLKKNHDIFIDFANFSFSEEFKTIKKKKFAWFHGSTMVFQLFFENMIGKDVYDKIICLSESFRNDLVEKHPDLAEKIGFIYNPISVAEVQKLAKHKTSIDIKCPYLIAVQRLDNFDKNVTTIIEAFNQYSQVDKNTKLYIVGDGPDKAQLVKLAQSNKNIVFTGQINNPYPLIKNAQALILSSTKKIGEGLPNTLLEAQVLETLAISSDVKSGVREILLNGQAGLLFEAENPKSLAEKLVYVKNHPTECQQMVQTATENLNRFGVENAVRNFLKLCDIKGETSNAK